MGHQQQPDRNTKSLKIAFFLNLGFTILEFIGGLLTNSLAILSDALHDLGDTFSLGLAWALNNYSEKGSDEHYSYGYSRYSLLGAVINSVFLISGSLYILSQAVPRIISPEPTHATGMLLLAVGGIVVNGLAFFRLKGGQSLNLQVATWHLLEDVLGWVAVLIVGIILLFTRAYLLDPILSVLITLYVLYNMVKKLRQTTTLFLQGVPKDMDIAKLEQQIAAIEHVQSTHHTHVWSLDGKQHVISTHVVVGEATSPEKALQTKRTVKELLNQLNVQHITVEIEREDENCKMSNNDSQAQ